MGEWAELHDHYDDREDEGFGPRYRFDGFRDYEWKRKDGTTIRVRDMSNDHLLAAFKVFGYERFRDEMLIRMFEPFANPKVLLGGTKPSKINPVET
jgi:hypothetical protein